MYEFFDSGRMAPREARLVIECVRVPNADQPYHEKLAYRDSGRDNA
jgi:hypothetical protein